MTLRDKFKEVEIKKGITNELEKIADDFAIEFAEWLNFNFKLDFTDKAFEELLIVFKKEHGL